MYSEAQQASTEKAFLGKMLKTSKLTPYGRVHIEKLVKKFSEFYGTHRIITLFTTVFHLFLS
jgi:hypothetical protein